MAAFPPEYEPDETAWARRALLQRLESLQRSGVTTLAKVGLPNIPAVTPRASTNVNSHQIAEIHAAAPRSTALQPTSTRADASRSPGTPPANGGGSTGSPLPPTKITEDSMPKTRTAAKAPAAVTTSAEPFSKANSLSREKRQAALNVLNDEVKGCTCCKELVLNRTQTVFGVGNIQPRLCFFGEAPGADEDAQGEPFVGRAGQLLDDIITKGMGLRREDVFILNVLKCRPPNNRPPEDQEVANCRHFFERQLEILQPAYICCLGATAAKALLNSNLSIGKLRGRFHDYRGAKVIATYHPAYLLRNPSAKKDVWVDIKLLMNEMGIEAPKK